MKHLWVLIVFCAGWIFACESSQDTKDEIEENNLNSQVNQDSIQNIFGNVFYKSHLMPDQKIILNECDLNSYVDDSIFIGTWVRYGENHFSDPCNEEIQDYHVAYADATVDILAPVAGEVLEGRLQVRALIGASDTYIRPGQRFLGYTRKIGDIIYLGRTYLAYVEGEEYTPNPGVVFDVPNDFQEFSELMKWTYDQQNPRCTYRNRISEEEYRAYLTSPTESCSPPILDE